jgi:hypothetical protein
MPVIELTVTVSPLIAVPVALLLYAAATYVVIVGPRLGRRVVGGVRGRLRRRPR